MDVPKNLAPDKKQLVDLLKDSKNLRLKKDCKMVLLTAKYDPLHSMSRGLAEAGIGESYLMIGVYQLRELPKTEEEQKTLLVQRTKTYGNSADTTMHNQLHDSIPLGSKMICDPRSVGEIVDEVVDKFDGVKGVVHDGYYAIDEQGTCAEAFFKLELLNRIINEYF